MDAVGFFCAKEWRTHFTLWKHVFRRLRIHVQQIGRELYNVECSSRISCVTPQEQQFLLEQLLHPSGIAGQKARRAIVRMFPDEQQKIKVSKAVRVLQHTMQKI